MMTFFCHCCSLRSEDVVTPNSGDNICSPCTEKQQQSADWKCYHHSMCSKSMVQKYQKTLGELQTTHANDIENIEKNGKLKLTKSQYKNSIAYSPTTMEESMEYMQQVVAEMELREKNTANKTLGQMRNEIKESLEA